MWAVVDLAPGAEDNTLAQQLAQAVRHNLRCGERYDESWRRREFFRLRGSVALLIADTGSTLTLRFDFGRLTIHQGLVGVPDVTIRGRAEDLEALVGVVVSRRLHLPVPGRGGRSDAAGRRLMRQLLRGDLKIYGLLGHIPFVLSVLRVLSAAADERSDEMTSSSRPRADDGPDETGSGRDGGLGEAGSGQRDGRDEAASARRRSSEEGSGLGKS